MLTMFCLVSRQAMANVLPVLMFKPNNVVLFSTPEEKKSALNLEKLFKRKNIKVVHKEGMNAYDFWSFKEVIKNELTKTNDHTWLNITGGTKLMALAAYEAFAEKDKKIIYCDTEHQHIISLLPEYKTEILNADLSIEDYLKSYGYNIIETKSSFTESDYFNFFRFIENERLMRSLVNLYTNVRQKLSEEKPRFTVENDDKKIRFQKNLDTYIIHYGDRTENSFKVQSNDFKSGDWLEYYIYYKLKTEENLSTLMGVKISNPQGVENEIDVIALKDFRLYLYSCKTGKKDNQFDLYQLETLRNITSGTFGKGIFVTSNQHSEKFLKRAKELSIDVKNVLDNNLEFI